MLESKNYIKVERGESFRHIYLTSDSKKLMDFKAPATRTRKKKKNDMEMPWLNDYIAELEEEDREKEEKDTH